MIFISAAENPCTLLEQTNGMLAVSHVAPVPMACLLSVMQHQCQWHARCLFMQHQCQWHAFCLSCSTSANGMLAVSHAAPVPMACSLSLYPVSVPMSCSLSLLWHQYQCHYLLCLLQHQCFIGGEKSLKAKLCFLSAAQTSPPSSTVLESLRFTVVLPVVVWILNVS